MCIERSRWPTVIVLCAVTLSGCSVLSPQPDLSRYFVLRPVAAESVSEAPLTDLVLGFGPVRVPSYVDRIELIERVGDNEVRFSDTNRWVEPLGGQLRSTLRRNLAVLLQPEALFVHPWLGDEGVQLQVEIDFQGIEVDSSGVWRGEVEWLIRDAQSQNILERHAFTIESSPSSSSVGGSRDDPTAGLAAELARLSREVAGAVRRLHTRRGGSPSRSREKSPDHLR